MKKKIFSIICVFVLVFSFVSCSDENSGSPNTGTPFGNGNQPALSPLGNASDSQKSYPADITFEAPERGRIHITSYKICSDPNSPNEKLIVLYFDYTNLFTRDLSPGIMSSYLNLYQDNALLSSCLWYEEEVSTKIKPNTTISAAFTYYLRNSTSDVLIECSGPDELYGSETVPIV